MTTNTRKLVLVAILSALSFILMFLNFPLIPGADFLKIDFSIIPALFALILLDVRSGIVVLVLRSVLKLLLDNQGVNTYIGLPMNFIALSLFLVSFAIIWNKNKNTGRFISASLVGTVSLTVAMLVLNYVYAIPLYAKFANFDIAAYIGIGKYLLAMVIPFNVGEGLILAIIFYLVYLSSRPVLERYK